MLNNQITWYGFCAKLIKQNHRKCKLWKFRINKKIIKFR